MNIYLFIYSFPMKLVDIMHHIIFSKIKGIFETFFNIFIGNNDILINPTKSLFFQTFVEQTQTYLKMPPNAAICTIYKRWGILQGLKWGMWIWRTLEGLKVIAFLVKLTKNLRYFYSVFLLLVVNRNGNSSVKRGPINLHMKSKNVSLVGNFYVDTFLFSYE
jgi:hypothetical protein